MDDGHYWMLLRIPYTYLMIIRTINLNRLTHIRSSGDGADDDGAASQS